MKVSVETKEKICELERCELPAPIRSVDGRIRWFVVRGYTSLTPRVCRAIIAQLVEDGIIRNGFPKAVDNVVVDGLALLREKVAILKDGSWDDSSFYMNVLHETAHLLEKNPPAMAREFEVVLDIFAHLKGIGFSNADIRRIHVALWDIYGDYHMGAKVEEWVASDPLTKRMMMEDFRRRKWCVRIDIAGDTPEKATVKAGLEFIAARVEFVHAGLVKFDEPFGVFNFESTYTDSRNFMIAALAWLKVIPGYRVRFGPAQECQR